MIFQGKTYEKTHPTPNLIVKILAKEKSMNLLYIEDHLRYKLEIKGGDGNIEMKIPNQDSNTFDIYFKKATKFKYLKLDTGDPKWILANELRD